LRIYSLDAFDGGLDKLFGRRFLPAHKLGLRGGIEVGIQV
jgi:hypothetical protein